MSLVGSQLSEIIQLLFLIVSVVLIKLNFLKKEAYLVQVHSFQSLVNTPHNLPSLSIPNI